MTEPFIRILVTAFLLGIGTAEAYSGPLYAPPAPATTPSPATPAPAPAARPVLIPGTGFTGPTAEPGTVGMPGAFLADAKVIAHWDVVPHQDVTAPLNVGVVAFHANGIDRVAYCVEGGPWVDSAAPAQNPQTKVVEYFVTLDPARFATSGPVEIRAIAYPKTTGLPRLLGAGSEGPEAVGSLVLFIHKGDQPNPGAFAAPPPAGSDSSGDGSRQKPFATIARAAHAVQAARGDGRADGGHVLLLPGDYAYGDPGPAGVVTRDRYLTIAAAPGVKPEQVRLTSYSETGGMNTKLVHIKGLTVLSNARGSILRATTGSGATLWVDQVAITGNDPRTADSGVGGWSRVFVTDAAVASVTSAITGADLIRNVRVTRITAWAFAYSKLVVNATASHINALDTDYHPDVVTWDTGSANRILYNVHATTGIKAQGVANTHGNTLRDAAIVDCTIVCDSNAFMFGGPTTNLFVRDSSFSGNCLWRDDMAFIGKNIVIENCDFPRMPQNRPTSALTKSPGVRGVLYRSAQP